jgi:hypothetical protein
MGGLLNALLAGPWSLNPWLAVRPRSFRTTQKRTLRTCTGLDQTNKVGPDFPYRSLPLFCTTARTTAPVVRTRQSAPAYAAAQPIVSQDSTENAITIPASIFCSAYSNSNL